MKLLLYIAFLIIVTSGASWLGDHAGHVTLVWLGYEIETSMAVLLPALLVTFLLLWLILHWLYQLWSLPRRLGEKHHYNAQKKGMDALTQAMVAYSEQDAHSAQKSLDKARRYLADSPLPGIIQLQIAAQEKNTGIAQKQFLKLEQYETTRPLALRGMIEQARLQGDMQTAQEKTRELLKFSPNHATSQQLATDILSYHRHWQEAIKWLKKAHQQGHVQKEDYKHLHASILTQQGLCALADKNREAALSLFRKAHQMAPRLAIATTHYVMLLKQVGKNTKAYAAIRESWAAQPSQLLADSFCDLYADLPQEKFARKARELARIREGSYEANLLLAEAEMRLKAWDKAQNHLKAAMSIRTTIRLCRMMAALQRKGYQNESEERLWLERAVSAKPDAQWQCLNCDDTPEEWQLHCQQCNHFSSVEWKMPTIQ